MFVLKRDVKLQLTHSPVNSGDGHVRQGKHWRKYGCDSGGKTEADPEGLVGSRSGVHWGVVWGSPPPVINAHEGKNTGISA